jgi:hypothetical protein
LGAEDVDEGVTASEFPAARDGSHRRAALASAVAYQHGFSGKYHRGRLGDEECTVCGKKASDNFGKLATMPSFAVPKCTTCFGK